MATKPTKPRPLGNEAREKLGNVELHIGDADRRLEKLSQTNLDASQARTSLWQALVGIAGIFGMGRDNGDEGGNGSNGNGEHT